MHASSLRHLIIVSNISFHGTKSNAVQVLIEAGRLKILTKTVEKIRRCCREGRGFTAFIRLADAVALSAGLLAPGKSDFEDIETLSSQ